MNLSIVLLDGEKLECNINKDSCVIGRSAQCDVVIVHEAMSRKHCLLEVKHGELFVTDLGSSNGVSIEGHKIVPNTPTPYQTYFSLTFGAVQSISIGIEEAKSAASKSDISSPALNVKRPKLERSVPKKTIPPPVAAKSQVKLMKIVAFVAVLAVLGYMLSPKDESNAQPTPEQIYE